MKLYAMVLAILLGTAATAASDAQVNQVDQGALTRLLSRHVNGAGWVDYVGLRRDRASLQEYLDTLRNVEVGRLPSDAARLSFWINAYNAFTLNDVLEYVDGKTDSVKKVDGFFDKNKHAVAGESLTLDEIEGHARSFHDPRVHFAINCASASCPKLQPFAFTAAELNQQLNLAAGEFLADPRRGLRLDRNSNTIFLSPIFLWYAGDFSGASSTAGQWLSRARAAISGDNLLKFVQDHAAPAIGTYIRTKNPTVKYVTYDWTVNSQKLHPLP